MRKIISLLLVLLMVGSMMLTLFSCDELEDFLTRGDAADSDADDADDDDDDDDDDCDHVYDNSCDTTCNECGKVRKVSGHKYSNDCDEDCNRCGQTREVTHTYSNSSDFTCNVCGATRVAAGHPGLPQKDWDGEEFVVLTQMDRAEGQAFNIVDLTTDNDDDLSDAINKAVYERNERIKVHYNAEIVRSPELNYIDIAYWLSSYGSDYGAFMLKIPQALDFRGGLLDMNTDVKYINLDEPWWDTEEIEYLSVKNRAFLALGDINTVDDEATWCVLFNKDVANKYPSLPNFYDTVKSGAWTLENMTLWASKSIADVNSDTGALTYAPDHPYQYGLFYQDLCATVLISSSGITSFTKESDGSYKENLVSLDFTDAIEIVRDHMMLENSEQFKWALNMDNISWSGDKWQQISRGGFMSGKALFLMCHVGSISLINSSHAQFGILPIPKLTDSQMEYGNTIQYANATCYVIPRTTLDPDFSGFMLEAMGYFSSPDAFESTDGVGSLRYAYYESLLKRNGGSERDDDSWDMLGLIFDNRTFDIGFALNNSLCNHVYRATTAGYDWGLLMSSELDMIESDLNEKLRY